MTKVTQKEPLITREELQALKDQVAGQAKDIEYLTTANIELKHIWKDTANILKEVWKELGSETRKIEAASRRR